MEQWKDVVGWEGAYMVSDIGRVRNCDGRLLAGQDTARYPKVVLKRGGKPTMKYIHRMVLEAFLGPCPDGYEARHLDGNRQNNRLSNLAWGSRRDNQADRIRHGTACRGESHPHTTISASRVRAIRQSASRGMRQVQLARQHGVSAAVIGRICRRETWRHIA